MNSASSSRSLESATSPFVPVSRVRQPMSTALVPVPVQCNSFPKHGTLVPNRVFIGGLAASVTEEELGSLFARYGRVRTVKIIVDRVGLSKGYGFVTFDNEEEVQQLLKLVSSQIFVLKDRKLNIAPAVRKQGIGHSLESLTSPLSPAFPNYYNSMPYLYPVTSPPVCSTGTSSPSVSVVNTPTTPTVPSPVPTQAEAQVAVTPSPSTAANPVPPQALPTRDVNVPTAYYATPAGQPSSSPYPYFYAPPVYFQQYPYTTPQWMPGAQWQWLSSYRQASPVTQYVYFGNPIPGTTVVSDPGTGQAAFVTSSPIRNTADPTFANSMPIDASHEGAGAVFKPSSNHTDEQEIDEPTSQYSHHQRCYLHASEPLLTASRADNCTPPRADMRTPPPVSVFPPPNAPLRRASSQRWSHEARQWNDVPWNGGGGVRLRDYTPDYYHRQHTLNSHNWSQYRYSSEQLDVSSSPRLSPSRKIVFSPASSHSSLSLSLNETLSCPEQITHSSNAPLYRHGSVSPKRRLVLEQQSPNRLNRDSYRPHHHGFTSATSNITNTNGSSSSSGVCLSKVSELPITPPATPSVNLNDLIVEPHCERVHQSSKNIEQVQP